MTRSNALPTIWLAVLALACAGCHRDAPAVAESTDAQAQASRADAPPPSAQRQEGQDDVDADVDDVLSHAPHAVDVPDADAPTAPIADGAEVAYQCEDGNLIVTYTRGTARISLPDGSTAVATLSKEASSRLGGEFYGGAGIALQRLDNTVQLQQGDGARRQCTESSSTG